jgi:uncharacterized membrane protein YcaP (DUF421 family)
MEPTRMIIRVLFAYVFLLAILRASGKRTVAQGTTFDFVVALVLGDLIDDMLWAEVPASQFIIASGVVVLAHLAVSIGAARSEAFSRIVSGRPLMFIRSGSSLKPALRREQLNQSEIAEMLRLSRLDPNRRQEIKSAWLERGGQPAVIKKPWARSAQKKDARRLPK